MTTTTPAHDAQSLTELAARHGLELVGESIRFNEVGLDFRVAFATTVDGADWVLRIPRRPDVVAKSKLETRILDLVKRHLPVAVPDWRIHTDELIAYPRLPGTPGLTVDAATSEVTWHFDQSSQKFAETFGKALAALHTIDHEEARAAGLEVLSPAEVRATLRSNMEKVKAELGVSSELWSRWQAWLGDESYWPEHSALVHGDLYAAHVMVDAEGNATGMLDWTEAKVADPATDFIFHLMGFGEQGLAQLLAVYEKHGGRTWPRLKDHCEQLLSAFAVNYGLYALLTQDEKHLAAARAQLGVGEVVPA